MTHGVWAVAGSQLRRWRTATWVLVALVGLAGGAALAGVAGARRTASAMDRFIAFSQPFEVFVSNPEASADLDAVAGLPQVADAGHSAYLLLAPSLPSGKPDTAALGSINPFVRISENGLGATSDVPYLVEGRLPDPGRVLEAAVNEEVAANYRLAPGGTLRMWAYTPEQLDDALAGKAEPAGQAFDFTVTAIMRLPFDLDPIPRDPEVVYTGRGMMFLGPAFWKTHGGEVAAFGGEEETIDLRLRAGSDAEAFQEAVRALPGGESLEIQIGSEATKVQREAKNAMRVEAAALAAFAAMAAAAGLAVVGQALSRQVQVEAAEHPVLRALGFTRAQLIGAALLRTAAVAVGGAIVAVAVAVAVSPLTPIGLARRAEVDPGVALDVPVFTLGAASVVLSVLAGAALATWRAQSHGSGAGNRRPRIAERLAVAGAPSTAVTGVAMALESRGPGGRALLRGAVAGALAGVAVAAAALIFGASLDRLASTPELHGWGWDVVVGNLNGEEDLSVSGAEDLAARPFVEGFSGAAESLEPLTINGMNIDVAGVDLVRGQVFPPMVEGRPPTGPGEVVLGSRTMKRLGLRVGDRVDARLRDQDLSLEVVGRAVLHPAVQFSFTLDDGAVVSMAELRRLDPAWPTTHFLVDYADRVDETEAFAALQADWGKTVLRARPPVEVENLRRVAGLPKLLVALVAALALGTLTHTTVASVRRRRRDFAVLKAIGFRRHDVAAVVRWQATTLVITGLVAGLPLGVVGGRWAWRIVAGEVGASSLVTPALTVVLIAPVALALANLVAVLPGHAAARLRPAAALRTE